MYDDITRVCGLALKRRASNALESAYNDLGAQIAGVVDAGLVLGWAYSRPGELVEGAYDDAPDVTTALMRVARFVRDDATWSIEDQDADARRRALHPDDDSRTECREDLALAERVLSAVGRREVIA